MPRSAARLLCCAVLLTAAAVSSAQPPATKPAAAPAASAQSDARASLKGLKKVKLELNMNTEADSTFNMSEFRAYLLGKLLMDGVTVAPAGEAIPGEPVLAMSIDLIPTGKPGEFHLRSETAVRQRVKLVRNDAELTAETWRKSHAWSLQPNTDVACFFEKTGKREIVQELLTDWKAANP